MPRVVANIALNKPTRQSSVYKDADNASEGVRAFGGANNGIRTGRYGFHTTTEAGPWWSVDLGGSFRLLQIRIYNRIDNPIVANRADELDVLVSHDGVFWTKVFSYRGPPPFGLDGHPLVVPVTHALPLRHVKIQLRNETCLHLDEVEVYGERFGMPQSAEQPSLPPLPAPIVATVQAAPLASPVVVTAAAGSRRIVHVLPRAGLANRMLQFMAAVALQDRVPGAILSNRGLPEWHFSDESIKQEHDDRVFTVAKAGEFQLDALSEKMCSGALTYVIIEDYLQDVKFYPDPERFREIFKPLAEEVIDLPTFTADEIVLNVRADEILTGAFHYPLVPAGFYRSVVASTGLRPVLMGQLDDSLYCRSIKEALPSARFIPSQGAIRDFQMLRSATHIVPAVSTFSWLGAWLSHAQTIHLPVLGFYHPTFIREIDLLPLQDPRYRFYLLPYVFGVPEREALEYHRRLVHDDWPLIASEQLKFIEQSAPFVRPGTDPGPWVDQIWYAHQYLDAAREIAQGWFGDFRHHYQAIGQARGYSSQPPPEDIDRENAGG